MEKTLQENDRGRKRSLATREFESDEEDFEEADGGVIFWDQEIWTLYLSPNFDKTTILLPSVSQILVASMTN